MQRRGAWFLHGVNNITLDTICGALLLQPARERYYCNSLCARPALLHKPHKHTPRRSPVRNSLVLQTISLRAWLRPTHQLTFSLSCLDYVVCVCVLTLRHFLACPAPYLTCQHHFADAPELSQQRLLIKNRLTCPTRPGANFNCTPQFNPFKCANTADAATPSLFAHRVRATLIFTNGLSSARDVWGLQMLAL